MARISDAELERLKKETSLEQLAAAKGVKLERHGPDNLVGRCPFHQDDTPSFIVSPKKNLWNCLGACRTGGSVVDFVMKAEGVSFRHAVELLRNGAPLSAAPAGAVKASSVRRLPAPIDGAAEDKKLLRQVVDYYHQTLKQSPEALDYLKKRGLHSAELLDTFKLGFANRTLGLRLPEANRKEGAVARERLQRLGVLRESTGHEHLNGSLVIPIFDEGGDVVGLYGRKVTANLRPGTPHHLYLPGPHRAAFNSKALNGEKTAIVCEALLDALTCWAAGFRNVISSYGVEGFTAHHLEALKRHGVTDVLVAYDADEAGDAAAAALAPRLAAEGLQVWRVLFPRGLDANAFALKEQPAQRHLGLALRQAVHLAGPTNTSPPRQPPSGPSLLVAVPPAPVQLSAPGPISETKAPETKTEDDEVVMHFGPRRYRVRGLRRNSTLDSLKVNLLVAAGDSFHVDAFDVYQAKARAHFITVAALELRLEADTVKRDLSQLLLRLEALQELHLKELLHPTPKTPTLSEAEREAALELLRAPNLLQRVLLDFEACGVVGEETNKLVGYLAAVSRKLDEPLAILIQSSSAAGKSSLMEAVLAFVPEEDKVKYSAMTGQSLFYMGDADLKHKVLAVVEEEGAARASYALKLLQSEGELTIASTGKNPSTGRLETHEYHVEGPTQLFLTTTATELDEELLNRCLVLTVDEERAQTQSIHRLQREKQTLEGLLHRREREGTLTLHQNAQRLLRPLLVANPFARGLTFLDDRIRARRDFPKYLTLIRAIALLHQHQREVKTVHHQGTLVEYVEVTLDDVATANHLAAAVLGRFLDELPPQTRRLLHQLEARVVEACRAGSMRQADYRFTRRDVRAWAGLSDVQARLHLERLVRMEYLLVHRGQRGQSFVYELLYDGTGKDGAPVLSGLAEVEVLRAAATATAATSRGTEGHLAGASRPQRGAFAAPSRGAAPAELLTPSLPLAAVPAGPSEKPPLGVSALPRHNGVGAR